MLESFKSSNFEYKKLTEEEQQKRGILGRLVGPIADFKNPTRNGRKYTEKLWEKVYSDPIVKEKIDNRCLFCELGHPEDRLEVDPEKICACIAEVPKKSDDGRLYTVIDILDTPNGRILKTLLDYGTTVGISSRGEGDLITDYNGDEIVDPDTYQYETSDIVLLPAVKSARLTPVVESLTSNKTLKQALLEDLRKSNDNDKLVMSETLESLGINLNEGIQYKGYDMTITQSGVQLRKSDGTFIQEFPTEEEAKEYIDETSKSLDEDSSTIKTYKRENGQWVPGKEISSDSSTKGVNYIKKQDEQDEAANDGDNLIVELQEALQKNTELTKLVKVLQEKLSVCYAKEKRFESQINTYKTSIKSLQESAQKVSSLESKSKLLEENLEKSKKARESDKDGYQSTIKDLNEKLASIKSNHKEKIEGAKSIVEELSNKIKFLEQEVESLTEQLEATKDSKQVSIRTLKETYSKKESSLTEKLANIQKDSKLREQQLNEKLKLTEKEMDRYKAIAQKAIDKYLIEKCSALDISVDDVKNRLGKSYSFNDISRICENLSANKLAVSKLPFNTSKVQKIRVKESISEPVVKNLDMSGDRVDAQLLSMVDRLS